MKVAQLCPTLYSAWDSPGQNTGVRSLSLLQGNLPNPGIEPRSPTLQADSLPAEPQGKPKNAGDRKSTRLNSTSLQRPTVWKWKWRSLGHVRLCDHMDHTVHGILQPRILEWVAFPFSRGIFPTQGLNPGLPHCRQILYQLSYEGSPSGHEFK